MSEYILILTVVNTLLLGLILLKTNAAEDEINSHDYDQGVKDERDRILKHLEETKHWRYPNLQVAVLFEEMLDFMRKSKEGQND